MVVQLREAELAVAEMKIYLKSLTKNLQKESYFIQTVEKDARNSESDSEEPKWPEMLRLQNEYLKTLDLGKGILQNSQQTYSNLDSSPNEFDKKIRKEVA